MSALPPIVAVVGATASGKSDLALDLAERLGGEIVNTDAMAVYRGMDIGTAKLPVAERRGIEHHLLDYLGVNEPLTVAQFQRDARRVIAEIRARGGVPVLVGGSALYTRAVLDRFEFPGTDEAVRRRLEAELAEVGAADAARSGSRRSTRSRPATSWSTTAAASCAPSRSSRSPVGRSPPRCRVLEYADPLSVQIGVDIDRPTLDERIERRVEAMFDAGFVAEVERLLAAGLREGRTAASAIGYREVAAYLDGEPHARRGTRADRRRHAAVRAQAGLLVPEGSAGHVGAVRRPATPRAGARRRGTMGAWVTIRSSRDTARRTTSCCCPTTTGPSTAT